MSSGEPAGIGPDICAMLAAEPLPLRLAVLGDPDVLAERAQQLSLSLDIAIRERAADVAPHNAGALQVIPVAARARVTAGQLDAANAPYVLELLAAGARLCLDGAFGALVTAPVHKSVISQSGVSFSGHTEYLAELTGAAQPVMLLAGRTLRVALATTHLPLSQVAASLDAPRLERIVRVIRADLERRFGLVEPRILVLGLNPHAGESGTLGREEIDIIAPVIERLGREGLRVTGPASADTAFTPESLAQCDVVLAMYHDQGLPVVKALDFGEVVNVTLGLPIVRTSVDHGTALPLAGTGRARHASLRAAVEFAQRLTSTAPA